MRTMPHTQSITIRGAIWLTALLTSLSLLVGVLFGSVPVHAASDAPSMDMPHDVDELRFRDFYQLPVGPYGLEATQRLLSLNGKRVRIAGYMAKRELPQTGSFILAPLPVVMPEEADGPADDLPASHLLALLPAADAGIPVPYQKGLFLLTGTLELGAREEADGRIYYVRLHVERPPELQAAR